MATVLALEVAGDATDAARALDSAGDAALGLGDKVTRASQEADRAASRFDGVGESADVMASRSSQAAGGLGDLGGALGLLPGPLGAAGRGMEALAPAIMGVTGASDLLNLVTESTIVKQARAKAAAIGTAIASRAVAAATKAQAAAQWLLNAAMSANPVLIVVVALVALAVAVVVAYKRSERFRAIVQAAMRVVGAAVGRVVGVLRSLAAFLIGKAVAAFQRAKAIAVAVFKAIVSAVARVVDKVRDAVGWVRERLAAGFQRAREVAATVLGRIIDTFGRVIGKVRDVASSIRDRVASAIRAIPTGPIDAVRSAFGWIVDKVQAVIDKVQSLIGWIGKIDFPKIPDLNPFNRSTSDGSTRAGLGILGRSAPTGGTTVNIVVNGAIDPLGTARTIREALARADRMLGTS